MATTTTPIYMRPVEIEKHLGISVKQLARWRENGDGPPWYRIGGGPGRGPRSQGMPWYKLAEVAAWVESHRQQ